MHLEEGASFARYTVEASLGGGGMGHVYRAFDPQLQRRVALKILHAEQLPAEGGQASALILREARAAAALNHANAVIVFEVGEHAGVPFMAMELVQGRPLRHLINRTDIALGRRLHWLTGVAEALAAAHAAGIVHLDVKPENVIVRDDDVAKVLDFGIARRRSFDPDIFVRSHADVGKLHTLTNGSGSIAGTPRYMAPEQVGREELDGRTDQFAWGVVAYELLTGKSPWPAGDDLYALFSSIIRFNPPSLRSLRPEVPEAVAAVVERALSKAKDDRFPTMSELVTALGAAGIELQTSPRLAPSWLGRASLPPVPSSEAITLQAEAGASPNAATVDVASIDLPSHVPAPPPSQTGPASAAPDLPRPPESALTQRSGDIPAAPHERKNERASNIARAIAVVAVVVAGLWILTSHGRFSAGSGDSGEAVQCTDPAQRSFASGSRALRSGNWEQARKSFSEAVAQDPECASAHARLVVIGYWTDPPSKTREALRHALDLKEKLGDRDRDLLHCYEVVLWSTPPDENGFAACLDRLSEVHPKDAELAYVASDFAPSPARARDLAQRALDIDPQYSDAWQGLAVALTREGKDQAALEALDQCVAHVTTSLDCLAQRAMLLRRMGRCADLEATGRKWIARSSDTRAHYTLAAALAAEAQPRGVVEEALATRWALLKGSLDAGNEPIERTALATLFGDFAAAEKQARALETEAKGEPDAEPRIAAALWLLDLGLETGALEATGALASDLWSRKAAWGDSARRMAFNSKALSFEPQLLRVLRMTKRMPDADFVAARAHWIDEARGSHALGEEAIWVLAHALPAENAADASEAVRSMPPSVVTSTSWIAKLPGLLTHAYAGRALLLAGRTDDALSLLKQAAASCMALEDPILHTQATLWLGQALAKAGDVKGACAAFATVQKRWGASSSSVTANLATEQGQSLGCPK